MVLRWETFFIFMVSPSVKITKAGSCKSPGFSQHEEDTELPPGSPMHTHTIREACSDRQGNQPTGRTSLQTHSAMLFSSMSNSFLLRRILKYIFFPNDENLTLLQREIIKKISQPSGMYVQHKLKRNCLYLFRVMLPALSTETTVLK